MFIVRAFLCFLLVLVLLGVGSCGQILSPGTDDDIDPRDPVTSPGPGAVLAQYGPYVYVLGGRDSAGNVTDQVRMVRIRDDGTLDESSWRNQTPLPGPREGATAFATGNLIYVLGGRDDTGKARDDIYFTWIDPSTGRLGFGPGRRWERNPRPLPFGSADAAWTVHEGRIFIAGGRTDAGATDRILHARIYADGQVGHWYEATERLSAGRWGSAAVVHGREVGPTLIVAGGLEGSVGYPVDLVEAFSLGEYGKLSPSVVETLPVWVAHPVLIIDRGELLLGGGAGGNGLSVGWYRRDVSGNWQTVSDITPPAAAGPSVARAAGKLSYLPFYSDSQGTLTTQSLGFAPEKPTLHPSSGLVPTRTTMRATAEPGTTIRYRIGYGGDSAGEVGPGDAAWTTGLTVTGDMEIALRAFRPDGTASSTTRHRYRVRSTSFFLDTTRVTVYPTEPAEPSTVAPGWHFFESIGGSLVIAWTGGDHVKISVFESDYFTPVISRRGYAMLEMQREPLSPVFTDIPAGRFYIFVESAIAGSEGAELIGIYLYEG